MFNFLIKLNLLQTLKCNLLQYGGAFNFMFFYNKSFVRIHKTAKIILENGNFHFGFSQHKEPFAGMLEMKKNSKLLLHGTFAMHSGVHVIITENALLELGNGGYINRHSKIKCFDKIKVGDDVLISENVTIWDSDAHQIVGSEKTKPITIGNHVWIGTNAIILKGVTIGDGAVIAAGTLVNKDIPPQVLAGGIPAKILKNNIEWKR